MNVFELNFADAIEMLCNKIEGESINNKFNIIEGWAEVTVNGIEYQVQLVLEPRQSHYTDEKMISIRTIDDEEVLFKQDVIIKKNIKK